MANVDNPGSRREPSALESALSGLDQSEITEAYAAAYRVIRNIGAEDTEMPSPNPLLDSLVKWAVTDAAVMHYQAGGERVSDEMRNFGSIVGQMVLTTLYQIANTQTAVDQFRAELGE